MAKYGWHNGHLTRKNEEAGLISLTVDQSGLSNQSHVFSVRFKNAPIVTITPMTSWSTYPNLVVASRSTGTLYIQNYADGNISHTATVAYYAVDTSPFPGT